MKTPVKIPPREMEAAAGRASEFLKTLSNEARLRILCALAPGEKSVSALCTELSMRQAAVSQQLQRLRAEQMVRTRRQGKEVYYKINSHEVRTLLNVLKEIFDQG